MIRPDHYKQGKMQPIEYMKAYMTPEEYQAFCAGNIIKYISRYQHKNGLEDIEKAETYLRFLKESFEENKE